MIETDHRINLFEAIKTETQLVFDKLELHDYEIIKSKENLERFKTDDMFVNSKLNYALFKSKLDMFEEKLNVEVFKKMDKLQEETDERLLIEVFELKTKIANDEHIDLKVKYEKLENEKQEMSEIVDKMKNHSVFSRGLGRK